MTMKAYKGFNKDMTCRGFQFEEGKTYEEKEASLCEKGFHACLNPLDVFGYYNPANSVFHEVELDDVDPARENDTKVCARKITVGARLSIHRLVELSVEYIHARIDKSKKQHVMNGDQSAATNTGYRSAAKVTGKKSIALAMGYQAKACGALGCWLVLAEWNKDEIIDMQLACVDGEKIKADTWYKLLGGKFVKVEE